jgi:UDP-N-acetylmuramoyl-L-alanyl-D-glutamate--2,6-diaminopimelate ligase
VNITAIAAALSNANELAEAGPASLVLTDIVDDSRRVTPGALFCAVPGSKHDGHAFIADAMKRGAAAVLVQHRAAVAVPQLVVRDARRATALAAAAWHGQPADRLRLIGVTGTNGKSTTVALVRHLLNAKADAGSLGTLGAIDGRGEPVAVGNLTTPGAVELQATLAALVARGVNTLAFEASSHALDQRRIAGLKLAAVVYTNLTHDHLDYHGDMEAYFAAKARLSMYLAPDGVEVVNVDDPAWEALPRRQVGRRVTWGVKHDAEVRAAEVKPTSDGSRFSLRYDGKSYDVHLPLMGDFNVANATGAAAAAIALGLPPATVAERLSTAPQVPGRMERLAGGRFVVLRDFAHTPDALERVIRTLKPLTTGRLIVLFGCGGDRDKKKRPTMGRIAARGADVAIVTSDNPRTEDPEKILDDIEAGMEGKAHVRLADRRAAIQRALGMLADGDCLLLAGKGHETYQVIGTEKVPMDEREIVLAALGQRS